MKERARCARCGTGLTREVGTCARCGRRITTPWQQEEQPHAFDYRPLVKPALVIGLLVLLGILVVWDVNI